MSLISSAKKTVENEAGSLEEIYRLAGRLPERGEVRGLAESYAGTVVEEGWPMTERGLVSARAGEIGDELRRSVMGFEPGTAAEQARAKGEAARRV